MATMNVIGTGLYPLRQAARLVGADARSVRRWMQGYEHQYRGERRFSPPLWRTQLIDAEFAEPTIGFQDLLELRLVNAFVKHGVSLAVIRATANAAREQFGADYPLTTRQFLTDGKRIFVEAIHRSGEERVVDVLRRQYVFSDIIKPSLYAGIEYDGQKNAKRWYPLGNDHKAIVLDPARQFGTPIVSGASIPTDTLYAAYLAEGRDRRLVGRIFGIAPQVVDAAVRFEESFSA
jgi:uncharacterized protein (DUF433 family)